MSACLHGLSDASAWRLRWSRSHLLRLLCGAGLALTMAEGLAVSPYEQHSLDANWKFHFGDIPLNSFPGGQGVALYGPDFTHSGAKGGSTWGAAARGFDDSDWRQVNLPHDWAMEQRYDSKAEKQQGYRPRGIGWYRRTFKLDPGERGKNIELQFDGVATHCAVYFNGTPVHHNWSGYTSFYIDVSSMARYGDDVNTIAVRVDAEAMEGWWYEGAGLYRHTWLVKRSPVHVITDGVYANPVKGADGKWTIPAEVTLANTGTNAVSASVEIGVFDSAGKKIAGGKSAAVNIVPMDQAVAKLSIPVKSPQLWSVDHPNLYTVRTTVLRDNKPVDSVETACGFRTIRFDAKEGFFLNDQPLKLQGTCNHQDHAGGGGAVPDAIQEFRIRKLKEMGSNAYRTAHDPANVSWTAPAERSVDGALASDEKRRRAPLTAAVQNFAADGEDVAIFTVSAVDAQGRTVPTANLAVEFEISGPGQVIGVGNGNLNSHEPEKGNKRSLFNGLAQIIVQSTKEVGKIKLTATADGLTPAATVLNTQTCAPRPFVP